MSHDEDDKNGTRENSTNCAIFGQFFQTNADTENQLIFEAQIQNARRNAQVELERYQEAIKNHEETISKIKNILNKDSLSPSIKDKAIVKLESLQTNLEEHKAKLATLIAADPSLQIRPAFRP